MLPMLLLCQFMNVEMTDKDLHIPIMEAQPRAQYALKVKNVPISRAQLALELGSNLLKGH